MKTNRIIALISAVAALASCTGNRQNDLPLLEGKSWCPEYTEIAINYMPEDNILTAQIVDILPEEDSTFSLNFDTHLDAEAYELYIGTKVYGVYLEKGETLGMEVRPGEGETENYELSFSGKNAQLSEFASAMFAAYDIFEYGGPDDDGSTTNEEYVQKLDSRHAALVEGLAGIEDKNIREVFAKQVEAGYNGLRFRLLMDKAENEDLELEDMPEYEELLAKCDPEDIYCLRSGFTFSWLFQQTEVEGEFGGDYSPICIDLLNIAGKIKNPVVKKACYCMIAHNFFSYGDHESGKDEFWAAFCKACKKYPDLIQRFQSEYERVVTKIETMPVPEVTLTLPNGKTTTLLEACKGKVTYIDVWATWCSPCCKQIPFLETLVEEMKDSDVNFISISVDEDINAWKTKIAEDKPQWAQYVVDTENNKALCDALNIRGIPRFMIVDSEGIIIVPEATRPSDEETKATLEAL